jgi:molybdate transport system substrate-binding protein
MRPADSRFGRVVRLVRPVVLLCAAPFATLLIACSNDGRTVRAGGGGGMRSPNGEPLLVYAAASLRETMASLADSFRAAGGDSIVLVFGATGDLTTQIENGAPADVLFAADEASIDRLAAEQLIVDSTRAVYALGRLAVIARCPGTSSGTAPRDCPTLSLAALAGRDVGTVAIADPSYAPYGRAARQALDRAGLLTAVQPKLVMGANVSQAEQYVRTGNADAGVVALSLVIGEPGWPHTLVDAALHDPIAQAAAVVAGTTHLDGSARLLAFVRGAAGASILERHGFSLPNTSPPTIP